ncbi:MAG TPA: ATP-binding protein [Acidimicrobiales bacterium]|nr:ATP-binding protein [Acidimicrobiales bacterium]
MSGEPDGQEFFATYRPDTAVLAEAREAFERWMGPEPALSQLREEMLVVLSELLSNAINASRDPLDAVAARAWHEGSEMVLEVTDPASAAFEPTIAWDYDDPLRPGGRGLIIVESLVDDIAIAPPDDSHPLRIRCRRSVPAVR